MCNTTKRQISNSTKQVRHSARLFRFTPKKTLKSETSTGRFPAQNGRPLRLPCSRFAIHTPPQLLPPWILPPSLTFAPSLSLTQQLTKARRFRPAQVRLWPSSSPLLLPSPFLRAPALAEQKRIKLLSPGEPEHFQRTKPPQQRLFILQEASSYRSHQLVAAEVQAPLA